MRILHCFKVYKPDVVAGITEVISHLAAGTPPDSQASILVCRSLGIGSKIVVDGIPVERASSFGQVSAMPISPDYLWRLYRNGRNTDVIAYHAPFPLVDIGINLGFAGDRAFVIHWHADIVGRDFLRPVFGPLLHGSIRRADRIIVTDSAMIDTSPYLEAARDKCRVIPYGIDTGYWSTISAADQVAIDELQSKHPRLVVACGRLVSYKGFDVLIRSMQRVNGHLVIIGTGPLEKTLAELTQTLGLEQRVTFAGYLEREQQRQVMNAGRAFVLSSTTNAEGFGIVQIEAMCCGLPIVNTSLPTTVPRVARNGLEGLTVEPGNDLALADAINRLLDHPALAVQLGCAGRTRARSLYDNKVFSSSVMDLYREALAERNNREIKNSG